MVNINVYSYSVPARFRSERKQKIYEDNLRKSKITLKNGIVKKNLNFDEYRELSKNKDDIEKFEYEGKQFSDFSLFDNYMRKENLQKEIRKEKLEKIEKIKKEL